MAPLPLLAMTPLLSPTPVSHQSSPPSQPLAPRRRGPKDPRRLAQALPSTACARLLTALILDPGRHWTARALGHAAGISPRALGTEVTRLRALGILIPGRPLYGRPRHTVDQGGAWTHFRGVVRQFVTTEELLTVGLRDLGVPLGDETLTREPAVAGIVVTVPEASLGAPVSSLRLQTLCDTVSRLTQHPVRLRVGC